MEIYISDWIHKFQNKTGLDAKANWDLYKSKRVCSAALYWLFGIDSWTSEKFKNSGSGKKKSYSLLSHYTGFAATAT